jgi:hypothetical protein
MPVHNLISPKGSLMANVIRLEDRRRRANGDPPVIQKLVDGETVECVDVDALTPSQFEKFFAAASDHK